MKYSSRVWIIAWNKIARMIDVTLQERPDPHIYERESIDSVGEYYSQRQQWRDK